MDHHTWKKWLLLVTTGVFGLLLLGQSILSTNHWINQPFPGFFVHENLTVAPYFIGPARAAAYSLWIGCSQWKTAHSTNALSFTKPLAAHRLARRFTTKSAAVDAPLTIRFRQ